MGRKKRPFINKKEAHHFYLVDRSQQDPLYHVENDKGGSQHVLLPANEKTSIALEAIEELEQSKIKKKVTFKEDIPQKLDEIDEFGFPTDGYNYNQHLASISGNGVFVSRDGTLQKPGGRTKLAIPKQALESEVELERMLEAITINEKNMDADIRALLNENLEDDSFDKLNSDESNLLDDDFVHQLVEAEKSNKGNEMFDYKAHISKLMKSAEEEESKGIEVSNVKRDTLAESLRSIRDERELSKADIDLNSFLSNEYSGINSSTKSLDDTSNGYGLQEMESENLILANKPTKKLPVTELDQPSEEIKAKTKMIITQSALNEDLEDEEKTIPELFAPCYNHGLKQQHDCNTIVNTFSTTDNLPTIISVRSSKSTKSRVSKTIENEEKSTCYFTAASSLETKINYGLKREKKETSEQKRQRKQLLKEKKRENRQQKKALKTLFKEETMKQLKEKENRKLAAVAPVGVSTFRI